MTVHSVPKPPRRAKRRRQHNSTLSAPTKSMNARNNERREAEFVRCYESEDRVAWIARMGCVICGAKPCDNAHVRGGGAGRKADAAYIVPLCRSHHRECHTHGIATVESHYSIDLERTAAQIDAIWQADQRARGERK